MRVAPSLQTCGERGRTEEYIEPCSTSFTIRCPGSCGSGTRYSVPFPFLGPDSGVTWALVRDVPGVHAACRAVQAVREAGAHDPPDAGTAAADQGSAEEVLRRPPAHGRRRCRSSRRSTASTRIMGCLPVLAQAPVFIGLFHVLRSFNRTGTGFGPARHVGRGERATRRTTSSASTDVQSFLSARLFGAPISACDHHAEGTARRVRSPAARSRPC